MTYASSTTAVRDTKIEEVLSEVKPAAKRLGRFARMMVRLQNALPLGHRYREDIGVGEAEYEPQRELTDVMVRSGTYF